MLQSSFGLDQVIKVAAFNCSMDYNQLMIKVYDPIIAADHQNLRYPKFIKNKKCGGNQK